MKTLATALAVLFALPAMAQQNCAARSEVLSVLAQKYGETRQSVGMLQGGVFELFANTETGTWTVITTSPQGLTCIRAEGEGFENVSEPTGAAL